MNPVDEYFKKDLENIEIAPSKDLWAEKIAPRVEGREEKRPVIWYRVAAVIVVLLSGWFVIDLMQPKADDVQELEIRKPMVMDKIEVRPTNMASTVLEPVEEITIELKGKSQLAEVSQESPITENEPVLESTEDHMVIAQSDPEISDAETPAEKPKIKVMLSLNTTSQTIASIDVPKEERSPVQDYARTQWENVKQGDKLEAPKERLINWPKIKVEGNPLRGMFAAKGE